MIVLRWKLVHRNQELDDLYDEYDIPMDDDEEEEDRPAVQKKSRKQFVGYEDEEDEYDDEYDDEMMSEYDEEYDDDDE